MKTLVYSFRRRGADGATLLEVFAVLCVAALVMLVAFPNLFRLRQCRYGANCVNNLKNIGLGLRTFAVDFNGLYPWQCTNEGCCVSLPLAGTQAAPTNNAFFMFSAISNELSTPRIIRCPQDARPPMASNTWAYGFALGSSSASIPSYFVGVDATEEQPQSILSGNRNILIPSDGLDFKAPKNYNRMITVDSLDLSATNLALIQWTADIHSNAGNILLGDGSVQQQTSGRLRDQFRDTYNACGRFRLLMPGL